MSFRHRSWTWKVMPDGDAVQRVNQPSNGARSSGDISGADNNQRRNQSGVGDYFLLAFEGFAGGGVFVSSIGSDSVKRGGPSSFKNCMAGLTDWIVRMSS